MRWFLVVAVLVLSAACGAPPGGPGEASGPAPTGYEVLGTLPHDPGAFTQGLELVDGVLYEGTGLEGRSSVRRIDPGTGEVERRVDLPGPLFGEGITVVDDRLWQLTWRDGVAIERDRDTLEEVRRVTYEGEGWGLCRDGDRLVMSDGTDELVFRDPGTFAGTGAVRVSRDGRPVTGLNELECAGGQVWANVWQTDEVVRIDPADGRVVATYDLAGLRPAGVPATDVLNGIAAVPGTDEFLLTGKNWPTIFRVRFTGG
ncbi:glutaminyl-peptide cyclotransferase [Saccharothrix longispora]|uniref:glutaminyl-peptide cyclotransferase n=1 Tax=Saccharothrix longispora TaxID=33920 RepID=UPI0028FD477C|nr:glutaminyl-peptide cyclotransferase [Saccharothrix longispora]MDU0294642.1 glutaminyl-peptide cyclotransferase [Saccharothrix longispora]